MLSHIFSNEIFYLEVEPSIIPWIKVFTHQAFKELTDMPQSLRMDFYQLCDRIELWMRNTFHPDKMNRASFGNYLPQVHMHIMARFKEDDYFPESMWGKRAKEGQEAFVFSEAQLASLKAFLAEVD